MQPVLTQRFGGLAARPATPLARPHITRRNAIHDESRGQSVPDTPAPQHAPHHRAALAATAWALAALLSAPAAVAAEDAGADVAAAAAAAAGAQQPSVTPVYFGNGCFWGRQYDFINTEKALGRDERAMSAVVGYAGGKAPSSTGSVCYYRGPAGTLYEQLGHAEVVQVDLLGDSQAAKKQYAKFAETYFSQFRKTPFGMLRLDPQDAGPGYRNVVGLPGGIDSPLFEVLQAANVNGMRLLPGEGNAFDASGAPSEDDVFNTVWVVDSDKLGFNLAEQWHQFHNGIGAKFPASYTKDLRQKMIEMGKIPEANGCPEYFFY